MEKACFNWKKVALVLTVLLMSITASNPLFAQSRVEMLNFKGGGSPSGGPRSIPIIPITGFLYAADGFIETTFEKDLGVLDIVITDAVTGAEVYRTTANSSADRVVVTDISSVATGVFIISFVNDSVNYYAEFQIE